MNDRILTLEDAKRLLLNAGGGDIRRGFEKCRADLRASAAESERELNSRYERELSRLNARLEAEMAAIEAKYAAMPDAAAHGRERRDEISGARTVFQRGARKLRGDRERELTEIRSQEALLHRGKTSLLAGERGRVVEGWTPAALLLQARASFSFKKILLNRRMWANLMPLFVLLALFGAYMAACRITGYKLDIDTIIISGIYVAIVAVGAVFIYSQGAFDMSLGNATLVCAAVGIMSYAATGNIFLAFTLCVLLGVTLGVVNAILANCLRLPVMVMTLTMQSVLSAVYANITADTGGYIEVPAIRGLGGMALKWVILVAFIIFCVVLFNYTKIGRRGKMIGANATCAKFTGISLMKSGIIAFAVSGIGLGLCGFLYITQSGSVNTGTALTSVGLNVIIAINLGGMPTSGGPRSRISAAIIGGFFCTILDEFFAAVGLDLYRFLAKGIIFLVAVCLTSLGNRPKNLA